MGFQLIAATLADVGLATAGNQTGAGASAIAAAIATGNPAGTPGGTPLLHGFDFLAGPAATLAVPAASSRTFTVMPGKPGYFIDIFGTIAAAATMPFYLVELKWQDATLAATIGVQHWYLAASTAAGPWRVNGSGPTRSPALTVTITNYDPAQALTVTYSFGESTAHIARDDWRTIDYATAVVPQYGGFGIVPSGLADGDMAAGLVANKNSVAIPASTTWKLLLPLYCGPVAFDWVANTAIAAALRLPNELSLVPALFGFTPLWFASGVTDTNVILSLPRCPTVAVFTSTVANTLDLSAVMTENVS